MEQIDYLWLLCVLFFFSVYEVNISRTVIFKVNWLKAEREDDDMKAAGIICHGNEVRKWFFMITNYYINEEINQIWET